MKEKNKVKRTKRKYLMESYYGDYEKYGWICQTCGRAWISREVAQGCNHVDEVQVGHNRFLEPIKLDKDYD